MPRLRLVVELPDAVSPVALCELLRMNDIGIRSCEPAPPEERPAERCPRCVHLTVAELAVLRAFTCTDSLREIAEALRMSEGTVKTHVKNLYAKLRVGSRAFAVGRALRLGLLSLEEITPFQMGGFLVRMEDRQRGNSPLP